MSRFDVELLGGPVAGRRSLQTPRREPPLQIPVVQRQDGERRAVAIYRYQSRDADGRYVYTFAGERRRAG